MTDHPRIACFLSTSGHSGVDRIARHLLPALARRGYRVDLLKVRRHGPSLDERPSGLSVIDLGSRHTVLCLPALVRYLRRARPLLLFTDKDRVNRLGLAARLLARVPTRQAMRLGTTVSVDLAHRGPVKRWTQRRSIRWLYPHADLVMVPSAGVADDLSAYAGLARGHIRVVAPPVIPARRLADTAPRPAHPWFAPGAPPLILGVGELCGRKDFATLIRAFAQVRAERDCRLMILGEGGARARLTALAAELGVEDAVTLPGFVDDPAPYMAHAALFVLSSRWEGLGFVLVEALATGTPVVATDCPSGPREVLDGGRLGPLVPVGNTAALARAMLATLANPPAPDDLRAAVRRYEIEAATDAWLTACGLPRQAASLQTG